MAFVEADRAKLAQLLSDLELLELVPLFEREEITFSLLLAMPSLDDSMKELGISKMGHRIKIADAVRKIKASQAMTLEEILMTENEGILCLEAKEEGSLAGVYRRAMWAQFGQAFLASLQEKHKEITRMHVSVQHWLIKRYLKEKERLVAARGKAAVKEAILFHSSSEPALRSICATGFDISRFGSGADAAVSDDDAKKGFFGRGHYFSAYVEYADFYGDERPETKERFTLLAKVLLGSCAQVKSEQTQGKPCRADGCGGPEKHDSHVSPKGNEFVVFRDEQVLPLAIVFFREKQARDLQQEMAAFL